MDNCLLVFSDKKDAAARSQGKMLACLFYLKSTGPEAAAWACLFFRGAKTSWALVKPGLACLFYLKSCSPLGGSPLASPIGGGEKTACLSFLSKELQGCSPGRFVIRHKKTPDISVGGSW